MWVLAATTGMRRSELAGVERKMVDLDSGTLTIEDTRVVVRGQAEASDGKSESSQRDISIDLLVGPEGRPLPRIRRHDVRHTYATMAQDAGHNIKTLSERIGHADVTVTGKIYTHKSRGTDRAMADAMGELIERQATSRRTYRPSHPRKADDREKPQVRPHDKAKART